MENIYFISDIHLDSKNLIVENKFLNFIYDHGSNMKELYILGDLFEFWIDDNYDISQNKNIISKLNEFFNKLKSVFSVEPIL
jgi:UDP-2,3-diacylglucosamine hydrolase